MCAKHWPTGHEIIPNQRQDRAHNSPSIFEEIRKSYLQKTLVSPSPNIRKTAFRL